MPTLGAVWIKLRPQTLVRFFSVDYIFLYQFGVYLAIWLWAIALLVFSNRLTHSPLFLFAPPVVFAGYLVPKKWGIVMCAAGDAGMSWGTGVQAWLQHTRHESSFGIVLTLAIGLCMAVRFIRDIAIFVTPTARPTDG